MFTAGRIPPLANEPLFLKLESEIERLHFYIYVFLTILKVTVFHSILVNKKPGLMNFKSMALI